MIKVTQSYSRFFLVSITLAIMCVPPILTSVDIHSNPGRWFYESWLFSSGHIPYRDFTWAYPPLGVLVSGSLFLVLGQSTIALYTFSSLIALAIGITIYKICRLHELNTNISLLFTAGFFGASNLGASKMIGAVGGITPSWPIGLFGILLLLYGTSHLLVNRLGNRTKSKVCIFFGATITLLSKPEFALATFMFLAIICIFFLILKSNSNDRIVRYQIFKLSLSGVICATIAYFVIGSVTGFANLFEGLNGYGQSEMWLHNSKVEALSRNTTYGLEAVRAFAGTIAIASIVVIAVKNCDSLRWKTSLAKVTYVAIVVGSISILGELISRNKITEAIVICTLAVILLAIPQMAQRPPTSITKKSRLQIAGVLFASLVSLTTYETLTGLKADHEILLMAPFRLSPWIAIIAAIVFALIIFRHRNDPSSSGNDQLLLVFLFCAIAGAMQARFALGLGSDPEYSMGLLASLLLLNYGLKKTNLSYLAYKNIRFDSHNQKLRYVTLTGAVIPMIAFLAIGKPLLHFVQHEPTIITTLNGPLLVKAKASATIETVQSSVELATPNNSTVISTSYTPWVNFITNRTGLLPVTQTTILKFDQQTIDNTIQLIDQTRPSLVIIDLINDNGTEFGGMAETSRSYNPWLWNFINNNYEYCAKFLDGKPRDGLWGARFYVQQNPSESAPDCSTFKILTGLNH